MLRLFGKVMCIILVLVSCLTIGLTPAYAEDSNIIKVSKASGKPGDQVNIKISIDKPDGIESFQFDLLYDDRVFNILNESDVTVSSTVQEIMTLNDFSVKNPRKLSFFAAAMPGSVFTSTETEGILSINFSIKSKAPLGTHALTLDNVLLYDDDAPSNRLPFSVVNGQVIVTQNPTEDDPGEDDEPSKPIGGGGGGGTRKPEVTPTPTPDKEPLDDLLKEIDDIINSKNSKNLAYDVLESIEKYIMEACTINIDNAEIINNILNASIVENVLKEAVDKAVSISE
ncbi:MAG TPA: hypothetical protein GX708_19810, partial [Gallicola sp.]|nr:hypothetical protein [Gallicola sp.]